MTTLLRTDRVGCAGVLAIGAACMLAGCVSLDGLIASLPRWPVATPAATNTPPPVITLPGLPKPATGDSCDLSVPLVDDPEKIYNGLGDGKLGGGQECPKPFGKDLRPHFVGQNGSPVVGPWISDGGKCVALDNGDGLTVYAKCFTRTIGGTTYQMHYIGWGDDENKPESTNRTIEAHFRSQGFWEMRQAK